MKLEFIEKFITVGPVTLTSSGRCMEGSIPEGANIRITRKDLYWPGDVVVFARGDDRLVSHRLLGYLPGKRGWKVLTRADRHPVCDAPAPAVRVLGHVIRVNDTEFKPSLTQRVNSLRAYTGGCLRYLFGKHHPQS